MALFLDPLLCQSISMHPFRSASNGSPRMLAIGLLLAVSVHGQAPSVPTTGTNSASALPKWTAQLDHKNMMEQLGIKRLRPGLGALLAGWIISKPIRP